MLVVGHPQRHMATAALYSLDQIDGRAGYFFFIRVREICVLVLCLLKIMQLILVLLACRSVDDRAHIRVAEKMAGSVRGVATEVFVVTTGLGIERLVKGQRPSDKGR